MTTIKKEEAVKTLIIIDGNSLINRAYYAIQRPMVTSEGIYTQGIFGFLNMLAKVIADYKPAAAAVAFDRKAPTFRHEQYKDYKAGRKKMPVELAMQLPLLKDVLRAMGYPILEIDGYEADDILGTVACKGEETGYAPLIITGDRDALQLASEKTRVLITKKGISEFELYDADVMMETYGFTPTQFIDYKALMGDNSDNIPGLPGVGKVTAEKLIREYGSVENLIASASSIPNARLREKVEEYAQQAMMSKRLATIFTEVPIELDFEAMAISEPDISALSALYVKLEFNSFLKKLSGGNSGDDRPAQARIQKGAAAGEEDEAGDEEGSGEAGVWMDPPPTTQIENKDQLGEAEKAMGDPSFLVLKIFGGGRRREKPDIYGINLLSTEFHWYLNLEGDPSLLVSFLELLCRRDIPLIGHHIQQDLYMLLRAAPEDLDFHPAVVFDGAVAQYLIQPTGSDYSLKTLALTWFSREIQDEESFLKEKGQMSLLPEHVAEFAVYGSQICSLIASLRPLQEAKLATLGLTLVWEEAELPLILPLAEMEKAGFSVDPDVLASTGAEIERGLDGLAEKIYAITGETFNINSPKQLGVVLFEKMGLPSYKKTQRGYGTGADILEKLRDKSPVIDLILEYRTLVKLRGTYIDGLTPLIGADGKIHAHFQQTVTATGRISCAEPNLQNIPVRQELGRRIRKAFVPGGAEQILIGADYSQIELRILAHFSQDPWLLEDFQQGADIHRRTAARVFGVEESQVTSAQRSSAKAVNFGIIYGISSFGLSEGLGITRMEAEGYIADYFAKHRAVKCFLDQCTEKAKKDGYVTTLLGRRRDVPEIHGSNYNIRQFGERLAMNTPIQGSAADIIKLAMIRVCAALRRKKMAAKVILQVHDELIVEAPLTEEDAVTNLLKEEMEQAYALEVPLVAEVNRGENWYLLK